MLNALVSLAAAVAPDAASWDPAPFFAGPTHSNNPFFTPQEPRTLVLALIGIGIMGAYAGMQRWFRTQNGATKVSQRPASTRRAA